jgi:hypothetical protein
VIAETWSVSELQSAEALAELEGWGQQKRLVARLCAEVHNAVINAVHSTHAKENSQPPKPVSENSFLPRRTKRPIKMAKAAESKQKAAESNLQKVSRVLNALAGY